MPIIKNAKELAAAYKQVRTAADPLEELKAKGYTFSNAIRKKLDTPEARKILTSQQRQMLIQKIKKESLGDFVAGPLQRTIKVFSEKYYHLTFGLRLSVVDQIMKGLYDTFVIPHDLNVREYLSEDSIGKLFDLISRNFTGFPGASGIHTLGNFYLTAPATVSPIDKSRYVTINQSFILDIDHIISSGQYEKVTFIEGSLHFLMQLGAEVDDNLLTLSFKPIDSSFEVDLPDFISSLLTITISPTSPLQPEDPSVSLSVVELVLLLGGFEDSLNYIARTYSVAPTIQIPKLQDVSITVQDVDIRLVATPNGGHLMVGALFGQNTFTEDPDRLELLQTDPFENEKENIFISVHETFFQPILNQMLASGELEKVVKKSTKKDNIKLKNARIDFQQDITFPIPSFPNPIRNVICFYLEGTAVNECGLFGINFKDVDFGGCVGYWLKGVSDGKIQYEQITDIGIGDTNITDTIICVILSLLDLSIISHLFEGLFSVIDDILFGGSDSAKSFNNIFNPRIPVPGTELLPEIVITHVSANDTTMKVRGNVELKTDTINTFVYLELVRRNGQSYTPIAGAEVLMMDQDTPKPPSDDIRIPPVGLKVTAGQKVIKIVQTSYRALENGDQQLSAGTTDEDGKTLLILSPGVLATLVGYLKTQTTINRLDIQKTETTTTEQAIMEKLPDVYFLIDLPEGTRVDTRNLNPSIFFPNLKGKHIGTGENPLRIELSAITG